MSIEEIIEGMKLNGLVENNINDECECGEKMRMGKGVKGPSVMCGLNGWVVDDKFICTACGFSGKVV